MKKYFLHITAGAPVYYLNAINTIAGALMTNGGYNSTRHKNGTYTICYDSAEELEESIKAAAEEINDEHGEGSASFSETSISYDSAYSEFEIVDED